MRSHPGGEGGREGWREEGHGAWAWHTPVVGSQLEQVDVGVTKYSVLVQEGARPPTPLPLLAVEGRNQLRGMVWWHHKGKTLGAPGATANHEILGGRICAVLSNKKEHNPNQKVQINLHNYNNRH